LLAGPAEAIGRARTLKQLYGGSMRQSGVLAAAGLYALDHHIPRLAEDHANARRLSAGLSAHPLLDVEPVETNIVCVGIPRTGLTAAELLPRLQAAGLSVSANARHRLRFVTHMDVSAADMDRAVEIVLAEIGNR
jgi:threonine aldolase